MRSSVYECISHFLNNYFVAFDDCIIKLEKKPILPKNDASAMSPTQPRVTLNFDLLTPKVDRFMSLLDGPLVPIVIKISSFLSASLYFNKRGAY